MSDQLSIRDAGVIRLAPRVSWADSRLLVAMLFPLALMPVLAVPIPAMVDYVNHLARMHILAGDGAAGASPYYQVVWALYPNLAMDLVVPPLSHLLGVERATKLFLLLSQTLVVSGAVVLEYAVKRRFGGAGLGALLMLYSAPFAWGFVNFEFALGAALWGIAAWLLVRERGWAMRLLVHTAFCALLFVSHLFALGLYGVALGLHELWAARTRGASARALLATMILLAAPALALVVMMRATGGSVGGSGTAWHLAMKPLWLFAGLNGYSILLSALGAMALALLGYRLARVGAVRFVASGAWLAVGFAVLFLAVPDRMLDTALVDMRVLVAAALILPAFVAVDWPSAHERRIATCCILGLILASVGTAMAVGLSYRASYAAMIGSFAHLDRGARILVATGGPEADPPFASLADYPMYHAPTLAVHFAGAFVPTLFTTVGKQPVTVRPAFRRLSDSDGGPVPIAALRAIAAGTVAPEAVPAFVRDWTRDFDYLYVVGPQPGNPLPNLLEPIEAHPRFAVFRIEK